MILHRLSVKHLLAMGTALRLLLAPFTAMPFDVQGWYLLSDMSPMEVFRIYYVPVWPLLLITLNAVGQALSLDLSSIPTSSLPHEIDLSPQGVHMVTSLSFNLLVKLPLIASDLAITFLICKIVSTQAVQSAQLRAATVLWYLNPFAIGISSVWGMYDTIAALFVMSAVYLFTREKKNCLLGGMSLLMSAATKLYALALLPATGLYMRAKRRSICACVLLISIVTATFIFLVFFGGAREFLAGLLFAAYPYPHNSMGLSYWTILLVTEIPAQIQLVISDALMVLGAGIVTYWLARFTFNDPETDLTVAYASSIVIVYLTVRGVNPQWFIWSLPLLAVLVINGRYERKLFWLSSMIGTVFLLTMFHILIYPLATYYPTELEWLYGTLRPVRTMTEGQAHVLPGIRPGTVVLWLLGTSFSATMLLTLIEILFKPGARIIDSLSDKVNSSKPQQRLVFSIRLECAKTPLRKIRGISGFAPFSLAHSSLGHRFRCLLGAMMRLLHLHLKTCAQ